MGKLLRLVSFFILSAVVINTWANGELSEKAGAVRGRIVDAENNVLPGASVYINTLHAGVTSDINGFYTISNIEPGTYTATVRYVGY